MESFQDALQKQLDDANVQLEKMHSTLQESKRALQLSKEAEAKLASDKVRKKLGKVL
jgi:hypothetical protein